MANGPCTQPVEFYKITIAPAIVATITTAEQTFTCTGLRVGQAVMVCAPSHVAGVAIATARVSAANTVAITFVNPTAAGVTPVAGVYTVIAFSENGI